MTRPLLLLCLRFFVHVSLVLQKRRASRSFTVTLHMKKQMSTENTKSWQISRKKQGKAARMLWHQTVNHDLGLSIEIVTSLASISASSKDLKKFKLYRVYSGIMELKEFKLYRVYSGILEQIKTLRLAVCSKKNPLQSSRSKSTTYPRKGLQCSDSNRTAQRLQIRVAVRKSLGTISDMI